MLTQRQVDRAWRLLQLRKKCMVNVMQMDIDIARVVGCHVSTISRLRRGIRNRIGRDEFKFPKRAKIKCKRCGIVSGTYCVVCEARKGVQNMKMIPLKPKDGTTMFVKRKAFSRRPDPSPEEIAERAARLRANREAAMRDVRNSRKIDD